MKLTQEQKRIKIAEACGWKLENINDYLDSPSDTELIGSLGRNIWGIVPDYFNDLNACHEMEKVLPRETKYSPFREYLTRLNGLSCSSRCSGDQGICGDTTCATAAQRAEAFGLTLNLWSPDQ